MRRLGDPARPRGRRIVNPTAGPHPREAAVHRLTIVMVADAPAADVAAFQSYEALVLPLLDRHAGRLERRLRSADGTVEVHIVSFASRTGYESYLADPERTALRARLAGSQVGQRVVEVHDVEPHLAHRGGTET